MHIGGGLGALGISAIFPAFIVWKIHYIEENGLRDDKDVIEKYGEFFEAYRKEHKYVFTQKYTVTMQDVTNVVHASNHKSHLDYFRFAVEGDTGQIVGSKPRCCYVAWVEIA